MNNFFKKNLSLIICAGMLAGNTAVTVRANSRGLFNKIGITSETELVSQSNIIDVIFSDPIDGFFINPQYESVIEHSEALKTSGVRESIDLSEYVDFNASTAHLLNEMKERKSQIDVRLKYKADKIVSTNDMKQLAHDLINKTLEHSGVPNEGDYIAFQYGSCSYSISYKILGENYYFNIGYNFKYYTTGGQEKEVDRAVEDLINELDIEDKSDYEKLEKIYNWMCENIAYDYDNLNDSDYLLKHTAYAALIDRKAVCQGYAVLLYRLALEAGIDARYISGIGNEEPHGWNIVRLGEKYYNIDTTWDAVYCQAGFDYKYFLRTERTFGNHYRNPEFLTDEFFNLYPMADSDFDPDHKHVYGEWQLIKEANCKNKGIEQRICKICGKRDNRSTALGEHRWCEWITVTEPTEKNEGLIQRQCSVCGKTEEKVLDKIEHVHKYTDITVSPTCTEQGYTTHTCIKCGDSYTDSETASLGHIYGEDYTVEVYPTRDKCGLRYRICKTCGDREDHDVPKLQNSSLIFDDLAADWYKPSVDYVLTNDLMNGKGDGKFSPSENMTRAQFATVLWRIAGNPESNANVPFDDLDRRAEWYLPAVAWAYENGIINGTSPASFDPNGNIKRQDMAVILYRYAEKYMGYNVSGSADLSYFPDAGTISDYAVNAIAWTNSLGIITGKDGQIAPIATGTRAEVATILMRFDLLH
ncbi:MAG: hypothetical protein HFE30_02885 [Clostridiales bacterium]|nr:hypothetical protein [Clostridiales bacterium]